MSKVNFQKFIKPKEPTVKIVLYQVPVSQNEALKRIAKEYKLPLTKFLMAVLKSVVEDNAKL